MGNHVRKLTVSENKVDFSSNDYLGLAHSDAFHSILEGLNLEPGAHGSTGSRLLTGNHKVSEEVEQFLASRWGYESCLIFPSGYMANLGLLSTLGDRHSTIIYDQYAHACIKDGARLSQARRLTFRHNDLNHLKSKLLASQGKTYVVVESIYSMDGDEAPLLQLCHLCDEYGAFLIVDEAHATGVLGAKGGGLTEELALETRVFARINTFGKGIGLHGGSVVGPGWLKELLVNQSRPFIYTTAPPPALFHQLHAAFLYLDKHPELTNTLNKNIDFFLSEWQQAQLPFDLIPASHSIQAVIVPGEEDVRKIANAVQSAGFDVRPILSPTVPKGTERIRICLHTFNTRNEISKLINALQSIAAG